MNDKLQNAKVDNKKSAKLVYSAKLNLTPGEKDVTADSLFIVPICIGLMYHRNNGEFPAVFQALAKLRPKKIQILLVDTLQKYNVSGYHSGDSADQIQIINDCKKNGRTWLQKHQFLFDQYQNQNQNQELEITDWDVCVQHRDFQAHFENICELFWENSEFQDAVMSSISPGIKRLAKEARLIGEKFTFDKTRPSLPIWNSILYVLEESAAIFTWSGYIVCPTELNDAMNFLIKNYTALIDTLPNKKAPLNHPLAMPLIAHVKTAHPQHIFSQPPAFLSRNKLFSEQIRKRRPKSLPPELKSLPDPKLVFDWIDNIKNVVKLNLDLGFASLPTTELISNLVQAISTQEKDNSDDIIKSILPFAIPGMNRLIETFAEYNITSAILTDLLSENLQAAFLSKTTPKAQK